MAQTWRPEPAASAWRGLEGRERWRRSHMWRSRRRDAVVLGWKLGGPTGGRHNLGQLVARPGPRNGWVSVAAGSYHTCGLKSDGTLWCWGANWSGQLGSQGSAASNVPVKVGKTRAARRYAVMAGGTGVPKRATTATPPAAMGARPSVSKNSVGTVSCSRPWANNATTGTRSVGRL